MKTASSNVPEVRHGLLVPWLLSAGWRLAETENEDTDYWLQRSLKQRLQGEDTERTTSSNDAERGHGLLAHAFKREEQIQSKDGEPGHILHQSLRKQTKAKTQNEDTDYWLHQPLKERIQRHRTMTRLASPLAELGSEYARLPPVLAAQSRHSSLLSQGRREDMEKFRKEAGS